MTFPLLYPQRNTVPLVLNSNSLNSHLGFALTATFSVSEKQELQFKKERIFGGWPAKCHTMSHGGHWFNFWLGVRPSLWADGFQRCGELHGDCSHACDCWLAPSQGDFKEKRHKKLIFHVCALLLGIFIFLPSNSRSNIPISQSVTNLMCRTYWMEVI